MKTYTDKELIYAATGRCKCGAGLAHPLNPREALGLNAWKCSAVLKGAHYADHDTFQFAFYKVREETSINNHGGFTTRPAGTRCLTKGEATCPKCGTWWESEPYNACGLNHHWFSGPCPTCGYAVGGAGSWSSDQGPRIKTRFKNVVVDAP